MNQLDKYLTTTDSAKTTVLIYGPPVSGKTTGARTFPNTYIIDFDGNLPLGVPNVIPMWNDAFVDKITPRLNPALPANRMAALRTILKDLASYLPATSTIVIDSLTRIETWYNTEEDASPKPKSSKPPYEIDTRQLFRNRLNFFDSLFTMFTACAANVVFLVHQQQDRDDKGNVTGQIKPALMGQIGEKMPGYFPIVLQTVRRESDKVKGQVDFLWRIRPSIHEPARVPKPSAVDFIPQNYNELVKYL